MTASPMPYPRQFARIVAWLLGSTTVALVVGWLMLTAADGEAPRVLGDAGAIGAMIAGAILLAKVLGPVLMRLADGGKSAGNGDREDGRWQGEVSAMLRSQTDAFREISNALRGHTEAIRDLVSESKLYHEEGRRFMSAHRRPDARPE